MSGGLWRGLVLLAAALVALSGCSGGPSQADENVPPERARAAAQEAIRGFFVVKALVLFYPQGLPEDPDALPPVSDRDAEAIEELLDQVLDLIITIHRAATDQLEVIGRRPVVADPTVSVRLTRTGQPIAAVRLRPSTSTIDIDIRTVQTIYRSVLVAQLRPAATGTASPEAIAERLRRARDPLNPSFERERLQAFMYFVNWASTGSGSIAVGDAQMRGRAAVHFPEIGVAFTSAFRELASDPEYQWVIPWLVLKQTEERFLDILGFLLAHELAHVVLAHDRQMAEARDECATFQLLESQADEYATWLLGFFSGDERDLDLGVLGYQDFFRYTYEIAGFEKYRPATGCAHPDVGSRVQALNKVKGGINVQRLMGKQAPWIRQMEERRKTGQPRPSSGQN